MQFVEPPHQREVGGRHRPRQIVHTATADAQNLRLLGDRQVVVTVDHRFALSNPALVSAPSRYAVRIEGLSERAAARRFGIDPRTVAKMMRFSVPPGYRRARPPVKPKLGAFIAIIDGILAADKDRPTRRPPPSTLSA